MPEVKYMTTDNFKTRQQRGLRKPAAAIVTPEQEFFVQNAGRRRRTDEPIPGEGQGISGGGNIHHERPDTVVMYKPTPVGFMPRVVPATAIAVNLAGGWKIACPDCGGHHSGDPNECPGRDPIAVRRCPVCGKRIYDNRVSTGFAAEDDDDPNVIHDDAYAVSTPATRTKAALDLHIWVRHPQEAREMALPPLANMPELVRDMSTAAATMLPNPMMPGVNPPEAV